MSYAEKDFIMKKRKTSLLKDTFRTIKKSFGRFLAIILMVALSTMVFIGLQMVLPNMKASLVNRLKDHNIHDVRIRSYAGIRSDDLKIIKNLPGDKKIEFASEETFKVDNDDFTLSIKSTGKTIDTFTVRKGRLPKNANEILLDSKILEDKGDMIGKKISLKNKKDTRDKNLLTNTEFTVVGYGDSVDYISLSRGGFNTGGADYFAMVIDGVIDKEYPDFALIKYLDKSNLDITSDEYKAKENDKIDEIKDKLKNRPDEIKAEITKEANEEITDGKEKIADAKKELAYGKKDLDDAKKELDDAKVKLDDGKKELEDNEKKLADAKIKLDDGKKKLEDNEKKLKSAKAKLDDGKKKLDRSGKTLSDSKKKLDESKLQLEEGKKQIDLNEEKLASGKKELDQGKDKLSESKKDLDQAKSTLEKSKKDLDAGKKKYKEGIKQYENNLENYQANKKTFDDNMKKVQEGLAAVKTGKNQLATKEKELKETKGQLTSKKEMVDQAIKELKAKLAGKSEKDLKDKLSQIVQTIKGLDSMIEGLKSDITRLEQDLKNPDLTDLERADLQAKKAQADKELKVLEARKTTLLDQQAQVESGIKAFSSLADLEKNKGEIEKGLERVKTGQEQIIRSKKDLEDKEKLLNESLRKLNEEKPKLEAGKAQLDEAKKKLDDSKKKLDQGQKSYDEGLKAYKAGLREYNQGEQDIKDAQDKYDDGIKKLNKAKSDYEAGLSKYTSGLQAYNEGNKKYSDAKKSYETGLKEYSDGLAKLEKAKKDYESGLKEYNEGLIKLNDGKKEYEESLKKYNDGKREYEDGKKEYDDKSKDAWDKIRDAEDEIKEVEDELGAINIPAHKVEGIYDNLSFSIYIDEIKSLNTISYIFTAMFYLVAILVTLTTILRMLDTERTQIGTLKALGYSPFDIMMKYMTYGLLAAILGSFLGIAVGHYILLPPIINAYLSPTNLKIVTSILEYDKPIYITLASILIVGMTVYFSIQKKLKEVPAQLMRPEAPKKTKRILIEKIPFIWKRLSFLNKVSIRNIFLHKVRMMMLIIGVAGSFGLIAMAFGIQSSIGSVAPRQFGDLYKYDGQVIYNEKAKDIDDLKKKINERSKDNMDIIMDLGTFTNAQNFDEEVNIIAVNDFYKFKDFIRIRDRVSKKSYTPEDGKLIINEKLSMVLNKGVGDKFSFKDSNGRLHELEIQAIAEQYFGHTAYMTEKTFKDLINKDQKPNANLVILKDNSTKGMSLFESEIMEYNSGISFLPTADMQTSLENISDSLNFVILVIVAVAALLTFVVLYNLTNINISERVREISTIKVLGFRTNEVSSYIFKENYFLTLVGILVGMGVGKGMHSIIIFYLSSGSILFDPYMPAITYLWASLLVIAFLLVVLVIERNEIRKIDMVEALKAVD